MDHDDDSGSLVALSAFIGAVLGSGGAFAATVSGDIALQVITSTGAAICALIWWCDVLPYA